MNIKTIFIGICAFSGLLWLFGPSSNLDVLENWKAAFNATVGILFLIAAIWTLIDLWQSDRSSDSKLYWTVLGMFFAPFVVPVYWYIRHFPKQPLAQQTGDANSVKPRRQSESN